MIKSLPNRRFVVIDVETTGLSPRCSDRVIEIGALANAHMVKRNLKRFPDDFMFQLDEVEVDQLVSQNAIPSRKHLGGSKPYVFTEQGVAMLATVLNSETAVQANIAIMRAFVHLRRMMASHDDLARKLDDLENKYDQQFRIVFDAIRELMTPPVKPRRKIGFERKE